MHSAAKRFQSNNLQVFIFRFLFINFIVISAESVLTDQVFVLNIIN